MRPVNIEARGRTIAGRMASDSQDGWFQTTSRKRFKKVKVKSNIIDWKIMPDKLQYFALCLGRDKTGRWTFSDEEQQEKIFEPNSDDLGSFTVQRFVIVSFPNNGGYEPIVRDGPFELREVNPDSTSIGVDAQVE